jgi:hypothetical protein
MIKRMRFDHPELGDIVVDVTANDEMIREFGLLQDKMICTWNKLPYYYARKIEPVANGVMAVHDLTKVEGRIVDDFGVVVRLIIGGIEVYPSGIKIIEYL